MKYKNYNKAISYMSIKGINKQKGLSLIELMIAMFIGLFLLVGITTSYLSSQKNSIDRDQYSILEDNGRLALEIMQNTLQHTGYASYTGGILDNKFIMQEGDVENTTCGVSSVINSDFPETVTRDGTGFWSDSLGVIYLGDSNISTDCSGNVLPASCQVGSGAATNSAQIYSAFYIDNSNVLMDTSSDPSTTLKCVGSRDPNSEQIIADGVENMQILYGLDTNADSIVDSYVNATTIGANGPWSDVVSIQVALLMRTLIPVKLEKEAETFTLLDRVYTVNPPDRFQRAVFSSTITLRNSIN